MARSHAVDQQLLIPVHHQEPVDRYARRIDLNVAGEDLPRRPLATDVRRQQPHVDRPASLGRLPDERFEPQQSRDAGRRIVESRRQPQAVAARTAHDRQLRHVKRPDVEILRTQIDRQRIAAVRRIEIQPRGEHPLAFDVLRSRFERQFVVGGIEQQPQLRSVGDLQAVGHRVGHRREVLHVDRQHRIVVHDAHGAGGPFACLPLVIEQRDVFFEARPQIFEDGLVIGPAAEGRVGEFRLQRQVFAAGTVLSVQRKPRRAERIGIIAVDHVAHGHLAVQVVQRPSRSARLDQRRKHRDAVAAVEMHTGKVGVDQIQVEIVVRPFGIESHLALKIEPERRIVGPDVPVEGLFGQAAAETQRIVVIAVEFQLRNAAVDARVDQPLSHDAVQPRLAADASQIRLLQQLPDAESGHRDTPLHRTQTTAVGGLHRQLGLCRTDGCRQGEFRIERSERSLHLAGQPQRTGTIHHRGHLGRQLLTSDIGGDLAEIGRLGSHVIERQREVRIVDLRQSRHPSARMHAAAASERKAFQIGVEIGNHAVEEQVDVAQRQPPVAQLGREVGYVVARKHRIAHLDRHAHPIDILLVFGPRIAHDRDRRDRDVRMRRYQPRVFHADTTVGQKEFPAEIVDLEPALLACGKPADLGADSAAVDGEIVDHGVDVADVHIRKIDPVNRIAMLKFFKTEFEVLDRERGNRKTEIALFLLLLPPHTRHDLLDVHHAVGHLPKIELPVGQPAVTQREPVAENAELGDEGVQFTDVEQRIAAVILDIKSFERDPVENPDIHPIDTDDRFEFVRRELRGPAHDEVLHGVDAQQQRQCKRKYDQQQNRRR